MSLFCQLLCNSHAHQQQNNNNNNDNDDNLVTNIIETLLIGFIIALTNLMLDIFVSGSACLSSFLSDSIASLLLMLVTD